MTKLGNFEFPQSPEEANEWEPTTRYRVLSSRVLVVARTRIEGAWTAFCDAVPGYDHSEEWDAVARHGATLDERVALAIFPAFKGVPYAD